MVAVADVRPNIVCRLLSSSGIGIWSGHFGCASYHIVGALLGAVCVDDDRFIVKWDKCLVSAQRYPAGNNRAGNARENSGYGNWRLALG